MQKNISCRIRELCFQMRSIGRTKKTQIGTVVTPMQGSNTLWPGKYFSSSYNRNIKMAHLGLGTLHLNRRGTSLFAKQLLDSIEQIEYVTVIGILVRL